MKNNIFFINIRFSISSTKPIAHTSYEYLEFMCSRIEIFSRPSPFLCFGFLFLKTFFFYIQAKYSANTMQNKRFVWIAKKRAKQLKTSTKCKVKININNQWCLELFCYLQRYVFEHSITKLKYTKTLIL